MAFLAVAAFSRREHPPEGITSESLICHALVQHVKNGNSGQEQCHDYDDISEVVEFRIIYQRSDMSVFLRRRTSNIPLHIVPCDRRRLRVPFPLRKRSIKQHPRWSMFDVGERHVDRREANSDRYGECDEQRRHYHRYDETRRRAHFGIRTPRWQRT